MCVLTVILIVSSQLTATACIAIALSSSRCISRLTYTHRSATQHKPGTPYQNIPLTIPATPAIQRPPQSLQHLPAGVPCSHILNCQSTHSSLLFFVLRGLHPPQSSPQHQPSLKSYSHRLVL